MDVTCSCKRGRGWGISDLAATPVTVVVVGVVGGGAVFDEERGRRKGLTHEGKKRWLGVQARGLRCSFPWKERPWVSSANQRSRTEHDSLEMMPLRQAAVAGEGLARSAARVETSLLPCIYVGYFRLFLRRPSTSNIMVPPEPYTSLEDLQ